MLRVMVEYPSLYNSLERYIFVIEIVKKGNVMTGFVEIPHLKLKCPFVFDEGGLTVYRSNSISIDKFTEFNIESDYDYVIGIELEHGNVVVFC